MNILLQPPKVTSKSLERVTSYLRKYLPPSLTEVNSEKDADIVLIHVIGRRDRVAAQAERLLQMKKKYAIIQYVLRSTQKPNTKEWIKIWERAKVVWSYYDLISSCLEDGTPPKFEFYRAPLGVDSEVFKRSTEGNVRDFMVCTSGQSWLTESVREVASAAMHMGEKIFHLGEELKRPNVECHTNVSDQELVGYYNRCQFVSGLRRKEGFELPAAEALICGAKPIFFDQPHYRHWYDGLGIFIPETDGSSGRSQVTENVEKLFKEGTTVGQDAIEVAKNRFDWKSIIQNLWERIQ